MDFAFSALLIFLLVLPGIILRYAYLRGLSLSNPFVISSFSDEVAYSVVLAGGLHILWSWICSLVGHHIDLRAVLTLLMGTDEDHPSQLSEAIATTANSATWVAIYFMSLYGASAGIGIACHEFVRRNRADHKELFRFHNDWHYVLSGEYRCLPEHQAQPWSSKEDPDLVYLSTVIVQGDKAYLYRGYVVDFTFGKDGELNTITLCDTMRRLLEADRTDGDLHNPLGDDKRFYRIVGDLFLIKYSEMQTINIQAITFPLNPT